MKGLEFYSAAATIIPVLILVFAIELPTSQVWSYLPRYARFMALWIFAFCVLAEYRALRVLYTGDARTYDPALVAGTLGSLALGIIFASTGNPFSPAKPLPRREVEDLSARVAKLKREVEEAEAEAEPPKPDPSERWRLVLRALRRS